VKVTHYLNQFFAGRGAEGAANLAPERLTGAVGPGLGLGLEVGVTLMCGDDYFAEHETEALRRLLAWLDEDGPDVLICGPSFGSGRYGYACGTLAREAVGRGVVTVCGMHPESPGVQAAAGSAYIVPTDERVIGMRDALPRMAGLARKLVGGESIGAPDVEGYIPRGVRHNVIDERPAAVRAVDLLLAKLSGVIVSEVAPPPQRTEPPPPIDDPTRVRLALVTESGLVPAGNPDRLESNRARNWLAYSLEGMTAFAPGAFESVHGGFDVRAVNADPNRLVPLDAVRSLEQEGRFGELHETLYTTTGNSTPVATAARFGAEIAQRLREAAVQAVILTGT
jgi:glycine reductase complex component B subunit gamma